jgi:type III pantothenate kinase
MRTLAINIGNSSLLGACFAGRSLQRRFRFDTDDVASPRGFTRLLAPLLKGLSFERIVLCSVVPDLTVPLAQRLEKTTRCNPLVLSSRSPHGLSIAYRDPAKLGTDRLAACLGASALYPKRNVIVVDFGTASTVTALSAEGVILGGAIIPGAGLWSRALVSGTAQLPPVVPKKPRSPLGRSPEEAIASGIFYGHSGALARLIKEVGNKAFGTKKSLVLATGGQAKLFSGEKLFTRHEPDLILHGLRHFAANFDHA